MGARGRCPRRRRERALTRSLRRLIGFALAFGVLLLILAGIYVGGMRSLEGKPRSFMEGLEFAAGALSTTGFGRDVHWTHPGMVLFVAMVQFSGVVLLFLLVPILLIPFLEERLGRRFPTPSRRLSGHLIVYRWGAAVESLLDLAANAGVPALVIDPDPEPLRALVERRIPVVLGDADAATLERAGLARARAVLANGRDDENGAAILALRESGYAGEVVAFVEDPRHRKALALAGASRVLTPRHVLGAALASHASDRVSPSIAGLDTLGTQLCVRETRIERGSPLAGHTLGEAGLGERTGAAVVGIWKRGDFVAPVGVSTRLDERDVAIAVGSERSVQELARLAGGSALRRQGRIVVAGHGEVGRAASDVLRTVGEETFSVDREALEGVDLVGDVLHAAVLEQAGVPGARAVVLALSRDSATLFATLLIRELDPEVLVVARANEAASVDRIHRAGADFVLSMSRVAARIVAGSLFGVGSVGLDGGLEVAELSGVRFAGRRVLELGLREASGATVVAVARGEEVLVSLDDVVVEAEDRIYVCGPRRAMGQAQAQAETARARA